MYLLPVHDDFHAPTAGTRPPLRTWRPPSARLC